jgi:hypothetical protein
MTGADIARRTRAEQKMPEHVEDQGVLAQIAQLLNADDGARKRRRPEPDHGRHRDLATG